MITIAEISDWMEQIAPLALSEPWDNTGLLLGCPQDSATRIQTCLTLTHASVDEAIARDASLVIAHHPLPFKPMAKITTQTLLGELVWKLASNRVAVYAPHTAWDSAPMGINALLAEKLDLQNLAALVPTEMPDFQDLGPGRIGELAQPTSLSVIAQALASQIPSVRPRGVNAERLIHKIAIACGSGGSLLPAAIELNCDLFLTGEATFHTCLEAEAAGISLLMIGHFASERFAMEYLADKLSAEFPKIEVWASQQECDPIKTFS